MAYSSPPVISDKPNIFPRQQICPSDKSNKFPIQPSVMVQKTVPHNVFLELHSITACTGRAESKAHVETHASFLALDYERG